jgi:hypothetical protein
MAFLSASQVFGTSCPETRSAVQQSATPKVRDGAFLRHFGFPNGLNPKRHYRLYSCGLGACSRTDAHKSGLVL